jgi:DNA-binding NtrC family response regulator
MGASWASVEVISSRRVLVVDDDPAIRRVIGRLLAPRIEVLEAPSCEAALQILERDAAGFSLVLLDIRFPGSALQGEQALLQIRDRWPLIGVVVMTVEQDIPLAFRCSRLGALDYITKFPDLQASVSKTVERALTLMDLRRENELLQQELQRRRAVEQALAGEALPARPADPKPELIRPFDDIAREHCTYALRACGGNMSEAARRLHIAYDSYRDRLIKWGIVKPTRRKPDDSEEE